MTFTKTFYRLGWIQFLQRKPRNHPSLCSKQTIWYYSSYKFNKVQLKWENDFTLIKVRCWTIVQNQINLVFFFALAFWFEPLWKIFKNCKARLQVTNFHKIVTCIKNYMWFCTIRELILSSWSEFKFFDWQVLAAPLLFFALLSPDYR